MHVIIPADARASARITLDQAKTALDLAQCYRRVYSATKSPGCFRKFREKMEEARILIAIANAEMHIP